MLHKQCSRGQLFVEIKFYQRWYTDMKICMGIIKKGRRAFLNHIFESCQPKFGEPIYLHCTFFAVFAQ
jgi:hypothetical protein